MSMKNYVNEKSQRLLKLKLYSMTKGTYIYQRNMNTVRTTYEWNQGVLFKITSKYSN